MKWIGGRTALWACLTIGSAVGAYAVGVGAPQADVDMGEAIMNQSCTGCHTSRIIDVQAMDKDQWTKMVDTMIQKGAQVKPADLSMFIDYLTEQHGPMPEGAGKKIVLNTCTVCHTLNRVKTHNVSKADWEDTLNHMIGEGADIPDENFPIILDYLSENFGEAK